MNYLKRWQLRNNRINKGGFNHPPTIEGVLKMREIIEVLTRLCVKVIVFGFIIGFLYYAVTSCKEHQNTVKECFMQDVKSKDCQYILWQEELRNRKTTNRSRGVSIY